MAKVSILGGGSWGIALAALLHKNGHQITIWSALAKEIEMLSENLELKTLPGVKLSPDMTFTTDDAAAVKGQDLLALGFAPGPQLGACLNMLLLQVQEDRLPNEKDALLKMAAQFLEVSK